MDIEMGAEPTCTVAVRRRTIQMSDVREFYDNAYPAVVSALARQGAAPGGPALGWYHGMPAATATVSAGFPVSGLAAGSLDDEVDVLERPGGPALTLLHQGSYDSLGAGWSRLMAEVDTRGLAGRGDFWEEYLTDPTTVADPSELQTRLVLPLA